MQCMIQDCYNQKIKQNFIEALLLLQEEFDDHDRVAKPQMILSFFSFVSLHELNGFFDDKLDGSGFDNSVFFFH